MVAYATRHGATAGIAERIAATLTESGCTADSLSVDEVTSLKGYDAVVLGGATYLDHWLKPAVAFAHTHQADLAIMPVWLFSSGPLGSDLIDPDGENTLDAARPKEFAELTTLLGVQGEQVFFGAYDPASKPAGFGERLIRLMPAAKNALPAGDFRDWQAIDEWAREIAADLNANPLPR